MRLLDQPDDLQLFGSGISHSSPPPSAIMLEQAQFQSLLGDDLLQRPGFPAQVLDLAAGRRARRVARKAKLASLQELLRPGIIQALGDAFTPAQLRDAVLPAQAVQNDADLLLG